MKTSAPKSSDRQPWMYDDIGEAVQVIPKNLDCYLHDEIDAIGDQIMDQSNISSDNNEAHYSALAPFFCK